MATNALFLLLEVALSETFPRDGVLFTSPKLGQEDIPHNLVLHPAFIGSVMQEPDGPTDCAAVEGGALVAKCSAQLVAGHKTRWFGVAYGFERSSV